MNDKRINIVGCGITGCVLARAYAEKGCSVTVYDRREHIGGNLYDFTDEHGIRVHLYGPHIFHTNSDIVWNFVNEYGEWAPFSLVCGAVLDGVCVPTAFDFTTADTFFPKEKAEEIKKRLLVKYPNKKTATVLELLSCDDAVIREYAEFLYEKDYKPYTAKQWAVDPEKIDRSIFSRVPVRLGYKKAYFDDKYQAMPKDGYTHFIANLLAHQNISVVLKTNMTDKIRFINNKAVLHDGVEERIIYTGALDELFGYRFGRLPYRSLRFEWKYEDKDAFQDMPVVAYPQAEGFTRITEYKKLPVQQAQGTTYAVEYPLPCSAEDTENEPYYPVLTDDSKQAFEKYRALADSYDNLICCGRLADFKYYNIDQAIENALRQVRSE
ncbi:MAG: UDP-galactopyranose mutase [Alphaproteobacteria bacterium]|nr:UDP-galactopyranose mutase [Alphaproteobacteria bacterium]